MKPPDNLGHIWERTPKDSDNYTCKVCNCCIVFFYPDTKPPITGFYISIKGVSLSKVIKTCKETVMDEALE